MSEPTPTHICLDCGALGYAGGYHDHGNGAAGDTISLDNLRRQWRDCTEEAEQLREDLRASAIQRKEPAEAGSEGAEDFEG